MCARQLFSVLAGAALLVTVASQADAQISMGTAFHYQGRLTDGGSPANGQFDFEFTLFEDDEAIVAVGSPVTVEDHPVVNGLFTVALDFGVEVFTGDARWLGVSVRPYDSVDPYTDLAPLQELTPIPYALQTRGMYCDAWGNVGIGTVTPVSMLDVAGTVMATAFVGDGSGLTGTGAWYLSEGNLSYGAGGGPLEGWGSNITGEIDFPAGTFTAVAAGGFHGLAIRTNGTLEGWGWNSAGQTDVPAGTFTAVAAGFYHSLAIRSNGTLVGWGNNDYGQITVPAGTFTAVAAGDYHSLAIRTDNTLAGWGQDNFGQAHVPAGQFTSIAAGILHSLAIRTDGTLAGWGNNDYGQTVVPAGEFIAIAAGDYHSLAIRADGTLAGWGRNNFGQINVPAGTFTAVAAGSYHSLAIRTDGTLVGWGNNGRGQINVPAGEFTAIAAGIQHSLAIRSGKVGIGTASPASTLSVAGDIDISGSRLHVGTDGNVGIGTNTPSERLDVCGNIRASGSITSLAPVTCPDYVFGEDYTLRSLDELRTYLKKHKHLPDVPSAEEVAANGIDLAGFQMRLLAKTEELTLYTIAQHEQLQQKDARIAELEKRITRMEAMLTRLAGNAGGGDQ